MTHRDLLIRELVRRLGDYSDDAIEGLLATERETCPRCGRKAARRNPFTDPSGIAYVYLRCSGCDWSKTRRDPRRT